MASRRRRVAPEPEVLSRWQEMLGRVAPRLGMYTGRDGYRDACAFVIGFDEGVGSGVLWDFDEWLHSRYPDRPELSFHSRVVWTVLGQEASAEEMTDEQDARVRARLFELIGSFLESGADFYARWPSAADHLETALELSQLSARDREFIERSMDRGRLVTAFHFIVRAAWDQETVPAELIASLAAAADVLSQHELPRWREMQARQAAAD